MRFIALEKENEGVRPEQYKPLSKPEARRVWELYQQELIREIYFRQDEHSAVIMLECDSISAAEEITASLPLVQAGLIHFELIPLAPYPGFARLFADTPG
ncbi:MAG: superoxide dismutase [Anaerolineae bacterium]|nr:superoxide dismutase [Anaerolineae bacterium]